MQLPREGQCQTRSSTWQWWGRVRLGASPRWCWPERESVSHWLTRRRSLETRHVVTSSGPEVSPCWPTSVSILGRRASSARCISSAQREAVSCCPHAPAAPIRAMASRCRECDSTHGFATGHSPAVPKRSPDESHTSSDRTVDTRISFLMTEGVFGPNTSSVPTERPADCARRPARRPREARQGV